MDVDYTHPKNLGIFLIDDKYVVADPTSTDMNNWYAIRDTYEAAEQFINRDYTVAYAAYVAANQPHTAHVDVPSEGELPMYTCYPCRNPRDGGNGLIVAATHLIPFLPFRGHVYPVCTACYGEERSDGVLLQAGESSSTPRVRALLKEHVARMKEGQQ